MKTTMETITTEMAERYSRQTLFPGIGHEGQRKIASSHITLIGLGALGSVIADELTRAGVGSMKIVDRDYVDISNLQRQVLYTEPDVEHGLPKAIAAAEHLVAVNSQINIEPVVTDVNAANIEDLIAGSDLVLDGTDNFETRFLINEACHKNKIPWVYGGAIGATGAAMNFLPNEGPCLRCLSPEMPVAGSYPTCGTDGVIGMIAAVVASIEATEGLKILIGSPDVVRGFLNIDLWSGTFERTPAKRDPNCPVCGKGIFELLSRGACEEYVMPLCTDGAFQVVPMGCGVIDLDEFAKKLSKIGSVAYNKYVLRFDGKAVSFNVFNDGRAVIRNAKDEAHARSIYSEYIGL